MIMAPFLDGRGSGLDEVGRGPGAVSKRRFFSLGFPLLVLLPLLGLAGLVYARARADHLRDLESRLVGLADVRHDWLETHLNAMRDRVRLVASRTQLRTDLDALSGADRAGVAELRATLAEAVEASDAVLGVAVSDPTERVTISVGTTGRPAGHDAPGEPSVPRLVRLDSIAVSPGLAEVWSIGLSRNGEALGRLDLWVSGEELLALAADSAGLGATGEALLGLIDERETLRFIAPVRFGRSAPLAPVGPRQSRLPLEEAITGNESFFVESRDYRGVPVVAATRHLGATGWGLVVKMDRSQAMAGLWALRNTLALGVLVIGTIVLGLGFLAMRRIRRDEERLSRANLRLRKTLLSSPFPAMVHAEDGEILLLSDSWIAQTGYQRDELATLDDWARLAYGERAGDGRSIVDALYDADGLVDEGVFRVHTRTGATLEWAFQSMALGTIPDGRRTALSMAVDLTEQVRLVDHLEETTERLNSTLNAMPLPFWLLDEEGRVRQCNATAEEVFGWTQSEVVDGPLPIVPPDRADEYRGHVEAVLRGEAIAGKETVRVTKDGTPIPVRLYAARVVGRDGATEGIVGIFEDLREEKEQARELRQLNRALAFVNASNAALVRAGPDADLFKQICDVALDVGGYAHIWIAHREDPSKPLELYQAGETGAIDILAMEDLREEIEAAAAVGLAFVTRGLAGGETTWETVLAQHGYQAFVVHPFPRDGPLDGFIALAHREPAALNQAEVTVLGEMAGDLAYGLWVRSLQDELFLIREAVANLSIGVAILDAEAAGFPLIFVNRGFERTTGYAADEALGRPYAPLLQGPETDPEAQAEIERALQGGAGANLTVRSRMKSGEYFWNRTTLQPIRHDDGTVAYFVAIQEDVTEQRRIGQELEHRARLSSVGELAGGIAHDFRNILTASQGLLELSLAEADLGDAARENLVELDRLVARGTAVTERLLVLSRRGVSEPRPTALVPVLKDAAALASHTLRDDVIVELETPDETVPVALDSHQFTAVMINLARNAAQAMPGGGTLTIEADFPVVAGEPDWWPGDLEAEPGPPWVRITVRDTGTGMDAETMASAFDPYFTTKPAGEGTGLGLSMVFAAIEGMSGRIWIESEVGQGTAVHLLIPTLDPSVELAETSPDPARPSAGERRTGTVLLAEDDPTVLHVFKKALERAGHTVLIGADGKEALAAFQEHPDDVDLVVTDGFMPRMSGAELGRAVWQVRPGLPVLVTSGFGLEDIRGEFPETPPGPLTFRPKPLSIPALLEAVQDMLSRPEEES